MTKTNDLKSRYINAAIKHGEGTLSGNYKLTNRQYPILRDTYKLLDKDELIELMDHPNPSVRTWAAVHSLKIDPEKAEKTLEDVSKLKTLIGFDAKITLGEWRKNTLVVE